MSDLRAKKKLETQERILSAAREVFLSQGYEKTTIANIARKANIGTGTFYNYFSSKSQLFLYIFFAQPQELENNVNLILDSPGSDAVEAVIKLCKIYIDLIKNIDKELLKEVIEVFFSDIEEHKKTMSEFIELDFQFIEQVGGLLSLFQQKGKLADTFAPGDAAESIYAIFMMQILMYLYEKEQSFATMRENLMRQVRLFFSCKSE